MGKNLGHVICIYISGRRDDPVGVPLDFSTPTGMSCIWRKLHVRQCVKISCFISCFSTIMTWKIDVTEKDSKFIIM